MSKNCRLIDQLWEQFVKRRVVAKQLPDASCVNYILLMILLFLICVILLLQVLFKSSFTFYSSTFSQNTFTQVQK